MKRDILLWLPLCLLAALQGMRTVYAQPMPPPPIYTVAFSDNGNIVIYPNRDMINLTIAAEITFPDGHRESPIWILEDIRAGVGQELWDSNGVRNELHIEQIPRAIIAPGSCNAYAAQGRLICPGDRLYMPMIMW